MKKNLIAFLCGVLGIISVWLIYQGYIMVQQHAAMWQWVQQTDRQLHPQQVVPPQAQPSPQPTRGK